MAANPTCIGLTRLHHKVGGTECALGKQPLKFDKLGILTRHLVAKDFR
jgi:hypothetical protein